MKLPTFNMHTVKLKTLKTCNAVACNDRGISNEIRSLTKLFCIKYRVFKYRPGESMSLLRTFRMEFLAILDHI